MKLHSPTTFHKMYAGRMNAVALRTCSCILQISVIALTTIAAPLARMDALAATTAQAAEQPANLAAANGAASGLNSTRINELQSAIKQRNDAIAALEKEISSFKSQIEDTSKNAQTLQGTIRELELTEKKLKADTQITENRIDNAQNNIERLSLDIDDKSEQIDTNNATMAKSIRQLNEMDDVTLPELVLSHKNTSDLWVQIDSLDQFRQGVRDNVRTLRDLKTNLETNRTDKFKELKNLEYYRQVLADQRKVIAANKQEKDDLLRQTKNKESEYKRTLAQKVKLRDSFQKEILDFESQLKFEIDVSKLPRTGSGVLSWPLDDVRVTQYFGQTEFAKQNAQVYNGNGHNGIDLRASVGTPIRSAAEGIVDGTGNTDAGCPGSSYGKWVLVRHPNGLATLYAHLSVISVQAGQSVDRRQTIGYSANTGYSTGPHLHFTVYASQGVKIMERTGRVCSRPYRLPLADLRAYLNPLLYL